MDGVGSESHRLKADQRDITSPRVPLPCRLALAGIREVTCHGKDGKTPILPEYPIIAGQNAAYILQQLKDIKSGARSNGNSASMRGIMHMVNEEEMKVLAEYISKLKL